jgi:hypothetical protein
MTSTGQKNNKQEEGSSTHFGRDNTVNSLQLAVDTVAKAMDISCKKKNKNFETVTMTLTC